MRRKFRSISISFLIIWVAILSGLVVTSCRLISDRGIEPTFAARNAWLTEWLEKPICQPPCFMGITPGITTITDTVQILSNRVDVMITRPPVIGVVGKYKELTWDFTTTTQYDGSRMRTDDTGEKILFSIVVPGTDQYLSLSDVVSSYGPPELVYLSDCRDIGTIVFFPTGEPGYR